MQVTSDIVQMHGHMLFQGADPSHGRELWGSDGYSAWNVDDMRPGSSGAVPKYFTEFKDRLYLSGAAVDSFSRELYWYPLQDILDRKDVNATVVTGFEREFGSAPEYLCRYEGLGPDALYMSVIVADGTSRELYRYLGAGVPELVMGSTVFVVPLNPKHLTVFDGRLFFAASDVNTGQELYWHNGVDLPSMIPEGVAGRQGS